MKPDCPSKPAAGCQQLEAVEHQQKDAAMEETTTEREEGHMEN
jgi:hypothetical protein